MPSSIPPAQTQDGRLAALCAEREGDAEGLPVFERWGIRWDDAAGAGLALDGVPSAAGKLVRLGIGPCCRLEREVAIRVPALPRSARDCGAAPSGRGLRGPAGTASLETARFCATSSGTHRASGPDAVAAVDVADREGVLPGSLRRVQSAQPIARRGLRRFGVLGEGTANSAAAKENQECVLSH